VLAPNETKRNPTSRAYEISSLAADLAEEVKDVPWRRSPTIHASSAPALLAAL
jgi:hypothetical protein